MRKIGALTKSEAPSSDEADDGLESLNDMLSSWANESLVLYARTLESFTLTANDGEYTIGSGADFNTTRPLHIVSAYVRQGTTDYPLEIISDENFSKIGQKSQGGHIPEFLNFNGGFANGTIKLWPLPAGAYSLYLLSEKEITALTLSGTVSLPAGWKRALIYNLAKEIAPHARVPRATVLDLEQKFLFLLRNARSKDAMDQANVRPPPGRLSRSRGGQWRNTQRREP